MVGVTLEGTSPGFAGRATQCWENGYRAGGDSHQDQRANTTRSKLDEHQRDHALFMAFAPAEDPKIAVAVIVENAGFGSQSAAPIARRVFDYWLLGQYPNEEDIPAVKKGGRPRRLESPALCRRALAAEAAARKCTRQLVGVPVPPVR